MSWKFFTKDGAEKKAAASVINPMAKLMAGAVQSIPSGTPTPLQFTSVSYDTDGMTNIGSFPTRITVQRSGRYLIEASGGFVSNGGGTQRQIAAAVNGVQLTGARLTMPFSSGTPRGISSVVVNLNAGDYVEAMLYHDLGSALNTEYVAGTVIAELSVTKVDGAVISYINVPALGPSRITTSALSSGPPVSPTDGDIWIATAVDAFGTRWMFQYNAGSASAYKCEFIGGSEFRATVDTAEATTSGDSDLATVGPQLTIARAGDYIVTWSYDAYSSGGAGGHATCLLYRNAGIAYSIEVSMMAIPGGGTDKAHGEYSLDYFNIAAGDVLKLRYGISNGLSTTFQRRKLRVTPRRIA